MESTEKAEQQVTTNEEPTTYTVQTAHGSAVYYGIAQHQTVTVTSTGRQKIIHIGAAARWETRYGVNVPPLPAGSYTGPLEVDAGVRADFFIAEFTTSAGSTTNSISCTIFDARIPGTPMTGSWTADEPF